MNAFFSLIILFIISDAVAAAIGCFVLIRYSGGNSFIRGVARVLGAFAIEQFATLIALTIDPVPVKHVKIYYGLIVAGRLIRSINIWWFTWPLFVGRTQADPSK